MKKRKNIDIKKEVKFVNPFDGEENMKFIVKNYNEETDRVYIQPINTGLAFPPQELVSIDEIENV